jgi:hypothetical protein
MPQISGPSLQENHIIETYKEEGCAAKERRSPPCQIYIAFNVCVDALSRRTGRVVVVENKGTTLHIISLLSAPSCNISPSAVFVF